MFAHKARLWALEGAQVFSIGAAGSYIPATRTRGAMATVMVEVAAPTTFRFRSGFERTFPEPPQLSAPRSASPRDGVECDGVECDGVESRRERARDEADAEPAPRLTVEPPPPRGFVWAEPPADELASEPIMHGEHGGDEGEGEFEDGVSVDGACAEAKGPAGDALPAPKATDEPAVERYQFLMYQERRPPLIGCWLVKGIIPVTQHRLFAADTD